MSDNAYTPLARVPLQPGDEISCLALAPLFGDQSFVIGTRKGFVYLLRIAKDGTQLVAGPLSFNEIANAE